MYTVLFVATLIAPVLAHPIFVGCDLKVRSPATTASLTGKNVMTTTDQIMLAAPVTKTDLVTLSANKFKAGTEITITFHEDYAKGFAHATHGTFTAAEFSDAKDAKSAACTSPATIKYKNSNSVTAAIKWTAPADVSSLSEVTLSFGGNVGFGAILRQEVKITNETPPAKTTAAPGAKTTAKPSGTQAPAPAGGATQVGVTLAFGIAVGVLLTRAN